MRTFDAIQWQVEQNPHHQNKLELLAKVHTRMKFPWSWKFNYATKITHITFSTQAHVEQGNRNQRAGWRVHSRFKNLTGKINAT